MGLMNILSTRSLKNVTAVLAAALITIPSFAQTTSPAPQTKPVAPTAVSAAMPTVAPADAKVSAAQPTAAEMAKMMELSKLNDNHKLLAGMAGTWTYTVKMWMDPKGNPSESKGTATRKATMDGRYLHGDYSGKFKMPGADGKMKDMEFKGMSLDGYDNVKQKFVSAWVDNMGTGIMLSDGTYDPATKTFTYTGEYEAIPGMKSKVREVLKNVDPAHQTFEYYEDRGAGEAKTMEIDYTRKK
jgi:hypothetical protein